MPINLNRAEKIGNDFSVHSPVKLDPNYKFADIEVLTINKVPMNKVSFIKDDHYECPTCGDFSIKMILDYRCIECRSKVIKWKCYTDEKEVKHIYYDSYIERFYEAVNSRMEMFRKKKEKELLGSEDD
tara:strand:- start:1038 stop:1421 length:384 start_codon:yes stop_codon:yes gene_type:complete